LGKLETDFPHFEAANGGRFASSTYFTKALLSGYYSDSHGILVHLGIAVKKFSDLRVKGAGVPCSPLYDRVPL
jgi:hypothetical protein